MKKEEVVRRKELCYNSYILAKAKGEKNEDTLENLADRFHVTPRTIQTWIYEIANQKKQVGVLHSKLQLIEAELNELETKVFISLTRDVILDDILHRAEIEKEFAMVKSRLSRLEKAILRDTPNWN